MLNLIRVGNRAVKSVSVPDFARQILKISHLNIHAFPLLVIILIQKILLYIQ